MTIYLTSPGLAVPPFSVDQEFAATFMLGRYGEALSSRNRQVMTKVFAHPGIRKRHFAFDDPACLVGEDPDSRAERFTRGARTLAAAASRDALAGAGIGPSDVSAVVVNTCTGYVCPGLSTYLIEDLALPRHARAYDLVGSGCGGAVPNLQLCRSLAEEKTGGAVLSVSVEICSATFQMGNDLGLIVSNALFGDGAAASVVRAGEGPFACVDSASLFVPEYREHIRFVHKGGQLHNQLSVSLPRLLGPRVAQLVSTLLGAHGLAPREIAHWALHPGGENIIAAVQGSLSLSDAQMRHSRKVLAEYGNMSSASVWFVLKEILDGGVSPGEWCVMLAFGAGLSVHGYLLRAREKAAE